MAASPQFVVDLCTPRWILRSAGALVQTSCLRLVIRRSRFARQPGDSSAFRASSGQSICLGEQQVPKGWNPICRL